MEVPEGFVKIKFPDDFPDGVTKVLHPVVMDAGAQIRWQAVWILQKYGGFEHRIFAFGGGIRMSPKEAWESMIPFDEEVVNPNSNKWKKLTFADASSKYYMKLPELPITEEMYF